MQILICTQNLDYHAESVAAAIENQGGSPIIFKRYNAGNYITYQFNSGTFAAWLHIDGKKYSLKQDIAGVFWRIKPALPSEIPGAAAMLEDKFRAYEWRNVILALESFVIGKSINPLEAQSKLSRKVLQLQLAIECGLLVPNTVVSNHSTDILSMLSGNKIIYKTANTFMTYDATIFTNQVTAETIGINANAIFLAPGIFQTEIAKMYELRVTIVAEYVFVVKIDSQRQALTRLDWRHDQREYLFSPGQLSEDTSRKLLEFHRRSGLIFATYDFIVDTNGAEIFLECNPAGQWLFVGDKLGLPISEAIAAELLKRTDYDAPHFLEQPK